MVVNDKGGRIVRVEVNLGAPTGEGHTYVTESGARWRSTPFGGVTCGALSGRIEGSGKFDARVVPER